LSSRPGKEKTEDTKLEWKDAFDGQLQQNKWTDKWNYNSLSFDFLGIWR
jgi:hypothetical protein